MKDSKIQFVVLLIVYHCSAFNYSATPSNFHVESSHGIPAGKITPARKREVDTTFHGHPKTKTEIYGQTFNLNAVTTGQSNSLIELLNKIAVEYLTECPPFILYDSFVEESDNFILQKLFQTFPFSFSHGRIKFAVENAEILKYSDDTCRSYILFLSNPIMTIDIIGPKMTDRVIVVARSSQWKLRDFLSSESSSQLVNLLVIGESLSADPKRARPYVLYTHQLYADGLGSNAPIVLTSWIRGKLSRPHINLFPVKFEKGFSGHRFLVSAVNQPPFIFRQRTLDNSGMEVVTWEGIEYRLMQLLSQKLNFSYELVEPLNTDILGSGEAVREEVQLGRADIGMAGAYVTIDRLKDIDMSIGHSKDCAAFVTLASKALPKYRAIMGPFQWTVWLALTAIYLLGIFPLAFTDKLTLSHLLGNWGEIENMFWYVFGTFTNSLTFTGKNSWSNSEKLSTRLLIGFYWIFTIIVTSCYTGSIIAFVTLPAFPDTVDSVNDLLGLFFRVGTMDKGGWEKWFSNSSHEPTAKLYKKMEFVSSFDEGLRNVTQSFFWNYAFLGSKSQLEYMILSNFSNDIISKRSALHLSDECFAQFQVAYTLPKNSVYSQRMNYMISRIIQSGLMLKIENDVAWQMQRSASGLLLQASKGHAVKEIMQEERQLTTADTEGMFLLMGAGYLIATLALISEVIGGFSNKCRQIMKRGRKQSLISFSSSRESGDLQNAEELKDHLERKEKRRQEYETNKPKSRFPGLEELVLTKATLKELYGGYRQKEPNVIMQNGQFIVESEAKSEDSSIGQVEVYSDKSHDSEYHENIVDESQNPEVSAPLELDIDGEEYDIYSATGVHLERIDEHSESFGSNFGEKIFPGEEVILEHIDDSFGELVDHSTGDKKKFYPL